MDAERQVVLHAVATVAYRTQKALRDAPCDFGDFEAGAGVRTPRELVRHMTSVLGYARTYFVGGVFRPDPLPTLEAEIERFHETVADLGAHLRGGTDLRDITMLQLLQGPVSDAMTHAGQLALLRRLAGSPVASENFIFADVSSDRLGSDQPLPAAPNSGWTARIVHYAWLITRMLHRVGRK